MVGDLVQWSAGLDQPLDAGVFKANLHSAVAAADGGAGLAKVLDICRHTPRLWIAEDPTIAQYPSLANLLRLSLAFDVPLAAWYQAPLSSDRLKCDAPISGDLKQLRSRNAVVATSDTIMTALDKALVAVDPPSVVAIARELGVSSVTLYRNHKDLTAQVVARRRTILNARSLAAKAVQMGLVKEAAEHFASMGEKFTAYGAKQFLGSRWPKSYRRLKEVCREMAS
jgi:transposase-like protein